MSKVKEFLQTDNTIDVLSPDLIHEHDLFFGPLTDDANPCLLNVKSISEVLIHLGLATSKSWCRKNNWDKEIPIGYSEWVFGSKRYKICILK